MPKPVSRPLHVPAVVRKGSVFPENVIEARDIRPLWRATLREMIPFGIFTFYIAGSQSQAAALGV
jgi:hypothetical protein